MNEQITKAENFGRIAFENGKSPAPALDKNIMDMIAANPCKEIGASLPILKAWVRGWHKANAALAQI